MTILLRIHQVFIAQERYYKLIQDKSALFAVLREGAEAADETAEMTLSWAKNAMGFTSVKDLYEEA